MERSATLTKVTIYSDGGASPNPGVGGWAALLIYGDTIKEISGAEISTTNNKMELTAAIRALEALKRSCEIEFYTDSEYVKNGITQWLPNWIKKNWRTSNGKPVLNQDLWEQLHAVTQQHTIHWNWVKGHANNVNNERVDQLATEAREKMRNQR